MRRLLVGCVVLLMLPLSLMANQVTLDGPSTGSITLTNVSSTAIDVTFSNPVTGPTTPAGGYSFANVGVLHFTNCTVAGGCTTVSGTAGTLTVGAIGPEAINWEPGTKPGLDGDSSNYLFNFTTPTWQQGDFTLNNPATGQPQTFDALLTAAAGTTATATISSGQVVSAPDGGMTVMLLGGALVGLATLRQRFRA